MINLAVIAAMAAIGVDYGYEPASDGHLEYIIQIEPQLVESLLKGQDINSEIPRNLDVRHYRLTLGTERLPRIAAKPSSMPDLPADDADTDAIGGQHEHVHVGYQPLERGGEFVIELEPQMLEELQNYDLSGKIPAGLVVTRFRVSTVSGTAGGLPLMTDAESGKQTEVEVPALSGDPADETADPPSVDFNFSDDASSDQTVAPPERDLGPPANNDPSEDEKPPADLPPEVDKGNIIPTVHTTPDKDADPPAENKSSSEPAKPWVPLTLATLLLLAIGGNIYLGLIAIDARSRCRELLKKMHGQNPVRT